MTQQEANLILQYLWRVKIVEAKTKILAVDDDEVFVKMLRTYLSEYPIDGISLTIDGVTSSAEAIKFISERKYDLLILDYLIDEMNGKEVVEKIRQFDNNVSIIILTGHSDQIPGKEALRNMDIQCYIEKTPLVEDKIFIQIMSIIKSIHHTKNTTKPMEFASMLKHLRELHNISQGDLAEYCGVKRQQISNYEMGQSKPSLDIAEKLADYFDISLDFLLCRTKKRK